MAIICVTLITNVFAYKTTQLIDPVDECIINCNECFKSKSLVNCANNCLKTGGDVDVIWKLTCSLFMEPSVQQV